MPCAGVLETYVPITTLLLYPLGSGSRSKNTVASVTRVSGVVFQIPQLTSPSALQNCRFEKVGLHSPLPFPVARDQSYPDCILVLSPLSCNPRKWEIRDDGEWYRNHKSRILS